MGSRSQSVERLINRKKNHIFKQALVQGLKQAALETRDFQSKLTNEFQKIQELKIAFIGEIARFIIKKEAEDPQILVHRCEELLKSLKSKDVQILISETINEDHFKNMVDQGVALTTIDAPSGTLMIKTPKSTIDASIEVQINQALEFLLHGATKNGCFDQVP